MELKEIEGEKLITMTIEEFREISLPYFLWGEEIMLDQEAREREYKKYLDSVKELGDQLNLDKKKQQMQIAKNNLLERFKRKLKKEVK